MPSSKKQSITSKPKSSAYQSVKKAATHSSLKNSLLSKKRSSHATSALPVSSAKSKRDLRQTFASEVSKVSKRSLKIVKEKPACANDDACLSSKVLICGAILGLGSSLFYLSTIDPGFEVTQESLWNAFSHVKENQDINKIAASLACASLVAGVYIYTQRLSQERLKVAKDILALIDRKTEKNENLELTKTTIWDLCETAVEQSEKEFSKYIWPKLKILLDEREDYVEDKKEDMLWRRKLEA